MVNFVGDVLEHCGVCEAFDKAPHVPTARTSTVAAFNEKVQVDLLFLGNLIVLRAMDLFSENSLLLPAQCENPQEVRDAFCGGWLGAFGPP